ncbi:MAG: hypothetical protein ACLTXH_00505 [Enterobacter hormaechei]
MFLLAVVFYGEVPGADKMVTFAFIWVALAIFVADAFIPSAGPQRIQGFVGRVSAAPPADFTASSSA